MEKLEASMLLAAACLISALLGSALTLGAMQRSYSIDNLAQVKSVGVEVYVDTELTVRLTEINWGTVEPNESKIFTCLLYTSPSPRD